MTQKVVVLTSGSSWADPGDTNGGLLDSVEVIAGGGGSEASNGAQQPAGGGGGEYRILAPLTVTFPVPYAIGAGGTAGASGGNGGTGGNTWFVASTTLLAKGGTGGATSVNGKGGGQTGNTGGVGGTSHPGGNAGTVSNSGSGGSGGGGAGGPNGTGGSGGNCPSSNSYCGGAGGGGNGGGTAGTSTAGNSTSGTAGGNNFSASGSGAGGAGAVGTAGRNGGGGGGGGAVSGGTCFGGGNGGAGSEWTATAGGTYGSGGGGGGSGGSGHATGTPGAGGLYGGGAGGGGYATTGSLVGAAGAQGLIVIKYTPVGGPHITAPQPSGHVYPSTQNLSCTTDTTSGTLYAVVDTVANISGITVAQVKAGENNTSAAAAFSGNHAVANANPSVLISGLSSGTTYGYALVQNATSGDSSVATGSFTVDSSPVTLPVVFQHVGGGGNPYTRAQTGNAYKIPLPQKSGAGNSYILAITYDGGATVSSVSGAVNGSLGSPVVSALPGAGFLDSRIYVLPNITSGQETITVTFSANVRVFQYVITEVFGIATTSPVSGSSSVANSTTIGAGSFTPTNNDANGGNFVWSYFVKSVQTPTSLTTSLSSNGGATLLNADIGWGNAADSLTKAAQGYIQSTAAAINPSISSASDTGDSWNSLAVALKISIASGTPPAASIRINKIDHFSTEHYGTSGTYNLQCPAIGNLRAICSDDPSLHATTVTDSDGNTWTNDGTGNPGGAQWWYLANAAPNPNLVVHIAGGGADATLSWRYFDFSYASSSPFDSAVASGQTVSNLTSFTASPAPSPTGAPGITVANVGLGQGPGLAVTAPSGAVWDLCTYTGEQDTDLIENADITAHYPYSASGAQTWTFSITSRTSNSTSGGFFSARGTAAGPSLSAATPSGTVTGSTQSIGCTTDTASGTLYVVVDTVANIIGASATQVLSGQNNTGAAAAFSANGAVSTTTPSESVSGLATGTTYGFALCQVGSADSNVLMGQFQTTGGASAAIVENADIIGATGAASISGSSAISEGHDVASIAGGLSTTGAATVSEGADAVTSAAGLSVSASSVALESSDIAAVSGYLSVSCFAALLEQGDIVVAQSAAGNAANAAISEQSDTASGLSALTASGAGSIGENRDAVVGSAGLAVTASASIAEASDIARAVGAVGFVGAAALMEGSDVVSASGSLAISAQAGIVESNDTASSSASLTVYAVSSILEGGDFARGFGATGNVTTAYAAIVEQDDVALGAEGSLSVAGSAAILEISDSVNGFGQSGSISGTAGVIESSDAVYALGYAGTPTEAAQTALCIIQAQDALSVTQAQDSLWVSQ